MNFKKERNSTKIVKKRKRSKINVLKRGKLKIWNVFLITIIDNLYFNLYKLNFQFNKMLFYKSI